MGSAMRRELGNSRKRCCAAQTFPIRQEIAGLQQQLSDVQRVTRCWGLDGRARTVATVIAGWTGVPLLINEG